MIEKWKLYTLYGVVFGSFLAWVAADIANPHARLIVGIILGSAAILLPLLHGLLGWYFNIEG